MCHHCRGIECGDLFIAQTAVHGQMVEVAVSEIHQTCDPQGFVEMIRILVSDEALADMGLGCVGVGVGGHMGII